MQQYLHLAGAVHAIAAVTDSKTDTIVLVSTLE